MIDIDQILSYGGTMVGGGVVGAVMGFALKKIIKIALVIVGAIFALLAYLQYIGWLNVNWNVVEHQSSETARQIGTNIINTVNNTAQQMNIHGLSGMDVGYPLLGIVGFVPGFAMGFMKG
jgi:uncharacterized membrane protein (Fun14 family)